MQYGVSEFPYLTVRPAVDPNIINRHYLISLLDLSPGHIYRVSREECARLRENFLKLKYTDITQNTYIQS